MTDSDTASLAPTLVMSDSEEESSEDSAATPPPPPPPTPRQKALYHQRKLIRTHETIRMRVAFQQGVYENWKKMNESVIRLKTYHVHHPIGLNYSQRRQVDRMEDTVDNLWAVLVDVKKEISKLWSDFHWHKRNAMYWGRKARG